MATQPPPSLPILYKDLIPLQSNEHANYKTRPAETAVYIAGHHAFPLTVDEFIFAQRNFPIVFSAGDNPVPLALMGLNEGVNTFVDDDGKAINPFYVPAYIRRYPFMLAKLRPDAQEMSLCFDPTSSLIGDFDEGSPLFEDGKPTENLNNIMKFCEDFEIAAQRTSQFITEVVALDLLIPGEVSIQPNDKEQPYLYTGFQMIAEDRLRELHGDQLRKINQNGILQLAMAHIFSLSQMRDLFGRQLELGKVPPQNAVAAPATA